MRGAVCGWCEDSASSSRRVSVGKNPALSLGMTQREVGKPHSEGWFRTEIH